METKNNTQISIPLDWNKQSKQEISRIVRQNWSVTFARQKKVSKYTKRIISTVMAMINQKKGLEPCYQLNASDIFKEKDNVVSGKTYQYVKKAMDEMLEMIWKFEDKESNEYIPRHLINTASPLWGYRNGVLNITLNPILKEMLLELAHYSKYELKWMMVFDSWYSMRLFELISAYGDREYWYCEINEYAALMDCEGKYLRKKSDGTVEYNVSLLIKKTTEKAIVELAPTKHAFEIKPYYEKNPYKRGRKKVLGVVFRRTKYKRKSKLIEFKDEYQEVLKDLVTTWKIKLKSILNHAQIIGIDDAIQLRRSFQKHENIKDREHYCTTAWNKVGSDKTQIIKEEIKSYEL